MIDLHMHSSYSEDGQFSPRELAEKCAAEEIRVMSVTDHNCARANAEARKAAEEKHITYRKCHARSIAESAETRENPEFRKIPELLRIS